jgi:hypothetical protein
MEGLTEEELIDKIVDFFEKNIFNNHMAASLKTHTRLSSYKINPIVVEYLSKVLEDDYTPEGIAKALYYPRVLGTSISTIFGTQIQNMFVELNIGSGSLIPGMDIEFIDRLDGRKKWCQLKSGPNTINSEDVNPLVKKFSNTINLAKTNRAYSEIRNTDFVVGVLYGEIGELSSHYKRIDQKHPVIIGREFWQRITGFPAFYDKLVVALRERIYSLNTAGFFEQGCSTLADEIRKSPLFKFVD